MPSPVGHGLAGLAVALAGDRRAATDTFRRAITRPMTLVCVALATLPDADLLIPGFHRHATHSIGATITVTIVAIAVTGRVNRQVTSQKSSLDFARDDPQQSRRVASQKSGQGLRIAWRIVFLCAAAHASHIVTDWLGADWSAPAGLQALWPWSDRFFISGWDLFPQIERRNIFSAASILINLNALFWELLLSGGLVAIAWMIRRRLAKQEL